ncbi:HAD family hydrolase [Holospora curviuscula]|uniref:phosphoglycolate phosphatase n=1 Tax=Holospora curviuscula TaxID=1082868 RepID=A0A2S5R876_9PROT|nr:HAD family hydrolase [Holospora curviuscula]PPE03518.1 Pyrophosphatase PpaX [Holospora curviuscula]
MKLFERVDAVFFDWDGTLVDTVPFGLSVMNSFLSHRGKEEIRKKVYLTSPSLSVRDAFKSMFLPHEYEDAIRDFRLFLEKNTKKIVPFDSSYSVLKLLRSKSIPMGIVSNQYGDVLRRQVKELAWESYFCSITGSGDWEEDKPSPLPLVQSLKTIGINPSTSVLFVGDSFVDMMCAGRAGCTPVSVGPQAETFEGNFISFKNIFDFYDGIKCSIDNNFLGER